MNDQVSVSSQAGTIRGLRSDGVLAFHSIPFLALNGAFDESAPLLVSTSVPAQDIDATSPQPSATALSVRRPDNHDTDLPVIAYIHGGSFERGSHADSAWYFDELARAGFVVVNLGYRLGVSGWLRFEEDEPNRHRAVDDCQLGLEWVQHNVEAFGGDPTNVTLVGHSAGATIALWLTRRDHYRGAFRRLIALSPGFPRQDWSARHRAFRFFFGRPLTRTQLNSAKPDSIAKAYRRLQLMNFTDISLGPGRLDPRELAEVDTIVSTTSDELNTHPACARVDSQGWGLAAVRLIARRLGMRVSVRSWLNAGTNTDTQRYLGQVMSDSAINRWVQYIADNAPHPIHMVQFVRDGLPAYHAQELPTALMSFVPEVVTRGGAWWPAYRPERKSARVDLDTGELSVTRDPLRRARLAFNPDL